MVQRLVCRGLLLAITGSEPAGAGDRNAPGFSRRIVASSNQGISGGASKQSAARLRVFRLWISVSPKRQGNRAWRERWRLSVCAREEGDSGYRPLVKDRIPTCIATAVHPRSHRGPSRFGLLD